MSEAGFTRGVCRLAGSLGLLWHHCPDSRRCKGPRGFPDVIVLGERGLLLAESKTEDGETSAEQDMWAWMLHMAGVSYELLRPSDLESGSAEQSLRRLR